jgi:hypothetical protein
MARQWCRFRRHGRVRTAVLHVSLAAGIATVPCDTHIHDLWSRIHTLWSAKCRVITRRL